MHSTPLALLPLLRLAEPRDAEVQEGAASSRPRSPAGIRAYRVTWSWEISRRGGFSEEDLYITREEDLYIMASRGRRI